MKLLKKGFVKSQLINWGFFCTLFLIITTFLSFPNSANATTGINSQINFQGKLVNPDGTNVADSNYSITFTLYTAATGGTSLGTETDTVSTTNGIFQVTFSSMLSGVNFNQYPIYLGIKVGSDAEMTPRILFTAVPYAFEAQQVNGLTVTDNGGNVLNIAASKTFTVNNSLTLSGTDSTSFSFPSTSGGVVVTSNAPTQTVGGTLTFSGYTSANGGLLYANTSGNIAETSAGTTNACLLANGTGGFSWGSCTLGGGTNLWQLNSNAISPGNSTYDLLLGATSTSSAKFAFNNTLGDFTQNSSETTGTAFTVNANGITTGTAANISANGLTTGNGLSLTSTSTGLTSGNLASLYWNPGSSTTSTGDLLQLNVGSNGTIGNIFDVQNQGSSVFSVSQSQITANLPVQFTSAGNTSFAYDINFTNPTSSNITSVAPLAVYAGAPYGSSNLTLGTYNSGNVIIDSQALSVNNAASISGQLSVGTTSQDSANTGNLYVTNSQVFGKALGIFNQTENADIFTASASGTPEFTIGYNGTLTANAYNTNGGILYSNGTTGTIAQTATGTSGYILQSNGGGAPTWVPTSSLTAGSVAFSNITSGTNTTAAMVVGSGSSLTYSGGAATSGVINANQFGGYTTSNLPFVNAATNSTLSLTGSGPYSLSINLANANTWSALQTLNGGLTVSGASNINTSAGTNTTNIGTGTTTGAIAIGGGSNTLAINTSNWGISSGGVASGLTGLSSSGTITFSGLAANSGIYTNGSSSLTTTPPSSGVLGYWTRSGTTISPATATDTVGVGSSNQLTINSSGNLSTSGTIATTGTGAITSAGLLTASNALTVSSGILTLPNTNTLTGVSGYTEFNNGISVGGGTTYYVNNTGTANLNAGTFGGLLTANASESLTGDLTQTSSETTGNAYGLTANSISSGNGISGTFNGLTTGNGLSLTSTSTGLTSGNLLNVNFTGNSAFSGQVGSIAWNPTSATTATGDLLDLSVGSNGTLSNIFNVQNNGSSVFSVSQSQVTSNLPVQFTAPGDTSFAYDINLTNPTLSTIKSNSSLNIYAGLPYNSSDLTLGTYNSGNVIIDSQALSVNNAASISGQLSVGTTSQDSANTGNLYVTNSQVFGKALGIFNQTENADIFTASASGTPEFTIGYNGTLTANAYNTNGGILYSNGTTGTIAQTATGTSGYILQSNGGGAPTWVPTSSLTAGSVAFSNITSGTNTTAAMVVGSGSSLTYSGGAATSGVINANQFGGYTTSNLPFVNAATNSTLSLTGSGPYSLSINLANANTWSALQTLNGGLTVVGSTNINTTGTASTAIGNSSGTFQLTSSGGLNITTGGALSGVASLDTITTSATGLTFAGAGSLTASSTNVLTLNGSSTGNIQFFSGSNYLTSAGNLTLAGTINASGTITGSSFSGAGTGLTGTASSLSIGGTASNITAYTINQNLGTGNSPTFAGLTIGSSTGVVTAASGVLGVSSTLSSTYGGSGANNSSAAQYSVPYYSATGVLGGTAASTNGWLLAGTATNPAFVNPSTLTVGTATNVNFSGVQAGTNNNALVVGASGSLTYSGGAATSGVINANQFGGYTTSTLPFVNNTTDSTLTRSGSGSYTLGLNLGNANTWSALQTFSSGLTVSGGNLTVSGSIASSLVPSTTNTYNLGSSTYYWNNGYINNLYANNVYAPLTGTSGYLQRNSGALSPTNISDDLLLGGTSTSSAKFAFLNNAGGTPEATTAGNLIVMPYTNGGNELGGNVGIGTTNPATNLDISLPGLQTNANGAIRIITPANGRYLSLGMWNTSTFGAGDSPWYGMYASGDKAFLGSSYDVKIWGGSGSGFDFSGNNIVIGGSNSNILFQQANVGQSVSLNSGVRFGIGTSTPGSYLYVTDSNSTVLGKALAIFDQHENADIFTASASGTPEFTIGYNGTLTANAYNTNGGILYSNGTTGTIAQTATGTSGYILQSNGGGAPTWVPTSSLTAGSVAFSNITSGTNTTAAMVVGSGSSLTYSGGAATSGVINANQFGGYTTSTLPFVNNTTDSTLTRSGSGSYTLGLNLGNANTWSALQTLNGGLTVSGASNINTSAGTNTTNIGTGTTTGAIAIGGGSNTLAINTSNWGISSGGVASGLTGLSSSGTITFSGLAANSGIYTNGSSSLTTTPPSSGVLGYWTRSGTTISPATATDTVGVGSSNQLTINSSGNLSTSGTIATTGTGAITSAGLLTASNALTVSSGILTLPNTNTLTGVSGYTEFNNGISVGGGTTYYVNNTGTANLNAGTFGGLLTANASESLTGDLTQTSSETTGNAYGLTANSISSGNGISGTFNGLTTGNGLSLTSTSTGLTSGNLASLYWNPGSSTTSTGDLLQLNVGSNGTIGNIFDVQNQGSSVFSVSQSQITANLPVQFTSAGNTSFAYDINFTNPTSSNITSVAPLAVYAGAPYGSSNLTLGTYNSGNVIIDSQALSVNNAASISGQLSVGTTSQDSANTGNLYVTNSQVFGKALGIFNQTENADIFTASASGTPEFTIGYNGTLTANAYNTNGGILYSNGTTGTIAQTATGTSGYILQSNGGGAPTWVPTSSLTAGSVAFSNITSGTNTTAAMVVGSGSSLTYSGGAATSGVINANQFGGYTTSNLPFVNAATNSTLSLTGSGPYSLSINLANANTWSALQTLNGGLTVVGSTNINTTGTASTAIGNSSGTFQLTSSGGLNITTGGALSGVASLDTITTSATGLTFAGAGSLTASSTNVLTLNGSSTGNIQFFSGSNYLTSAGNLTLAGTINASGTITGSSFSGAGTGLTGTASSLSIGGTASNITAYTINQNLGTGNSPTFAGLTIGSSTGVVTAASGVLGVSSTLSSTYGGSGANNSSAAQYSVPYYSATGVLGGTAASTNGWLLAGTATNPAFVNPSTLTVGTATNVNFSGVQAGTNNNALVVGASGSLTYSGGAATSGVINANQFGGYTTSTLPFVNNTTDSTLTRSGSGSYTLGLNLGNANTWSALQTLNGGLTVSGGNLSVNGGNTGGNAVGIFNQTGASTNDIITASSSGATKFILSNNGSLGIGNGIADSNIRTDYPFLTINTSSGSNKRTGIQFMNNSTRLFEFGTDSPANNTQNLYIYDDVANANRLTIDSSGNIFPGTNNAQTLGSSSYAFSTIYGYGLTAVGSSTLTLNGSSTGNIQFFSGSNTISNVGSLTLAGNISAAGTTGLTLSGNGANIAFTGTGVSQITTASNQNLALMPGGTGSVGIGTTTPSQKLDVAGNININSGSSYMYNGVQIAQAQTSLNNYFFGGAGNLTMTGSNNTAIGYQALVANTTGSQNSAIGYRSLVRNTTGANNTANGTYALTYNTTGLDNAANGFEALYSNTTGSYNAGNGPQTLYSNTTGYYNTANGYQALVSNTIGYYNTASGANALQSNIAGNYNLAEGYQSLYSNTSIVASLGSITGGSGYTNGSYTNITMSDVSGPMGTAPVANITVSGGVVSAVTLVSGGAGVDTTTVLSAPASSIGGTGSGFAIPVATVTSGQYNVALGSGALYSNTTASSNTAVGYQSLNLNTTGYGNAAIGYQSLHSNTTGEDNSALGLYALNNNIIGNYNTALGFYALLNNNANNNTAVGYEAGDTNSTGANNVFLGYQAGYSETGSNKLYIANSNTTTPLIYGAFDASALGINTNLGGNSALTVNQLNSSGDIFSASSAATTRFVISNSGYVGIGTTNPQDALNISGSATTDTGNLQLSDTAGNSASRNWRIANGWSAYGNLDLLSGTSAGGAPTTDLVTVQSNGYVGIGTTNPQDALNISGSATTDTGNLQLSDTAGNSASRNWRIANGWSAYGNLDLLSGTSAGGAPTTDLVTVQSNGYVGIGTTTPINKLEIVTASGGIGQVNEFAEFDPSGIDSYSNSAFIGMNYGRAEFGYDGTNTAAQVYAPSGKSVELTANGSSIPNLFISGTGSNTGNVGIGTLSPAGLFSVNGGNNGGTAVGIFNQTGATSNDIITASSSGNTRFTVGNNGNITQNNVDTTGTAYTLNANNLTTGVGLLGNFGALTSGNGLSLTSASTALTTGSLMNLNFTGNSAFSNSIANISWNPTSGAPSATGDLFDLNVGQYANLNNIFNVENNNASEFSVSQTQVTSNLPLALNATGDFGLAYNLDFTNPTSSYITSVAPLYLQAGEQFGSSNLVLNTFNAGSVVADTQSFMTTGAATVSGQLIIGQQQMPTSPMGEAYVTNSGTFGQALLTLNQYENADLFTASASGTPRFVIQNSGNVGVNNSNPQRTLDVNGTFGGNQVLVQDTLTSTQTVAISTPAMFYDLENNTGTNNVSATITFNLTGLPNVDGTIVYIKMYVQKGATTSSDTEQINLQINGSSVLSAAQAGPTTAAATQVKIIPAIRINGTWTSVTGSDCSTGSGTTCGDYAEWVPFVGSTPIAGNLLMVGSQTNSAQLSQSANEQALMGVVTTNPGDLIGNPSASSTPMALSGRVPVIVTSINGNISNGDDITSSEVSGVGMKATTTTATVGKALDTTSNWNSTTCPVVSSYDAIPWPADDGSNSSRPCFQVPVSSFDVTTQDALQADYGVLPQYIYVGKIMALVNISMHQGTEITQLASSVASQSAQFTSDISSLANQVSSNSFQINSLQQLISQTASNEAQLADLFTMISTSSAQTNFSNLDVAGLDVQTATISGDLNVLGKTTLGDLGVTGNITAGLLTINGLDGTIDNVASPLMLESTAAQPINLENGAVIVSTSGDIAATGTISAAAVNTGKINVTEDTTASSSAVLSTSAGVVTIPAGQTFVTVQTTTLTSKSLIFVTPNSPVAIGSKKINSTTFEIDLSSALSSNIKVNWWIVN